MKHPFKTFFRLCFFFFLGILLLFLCVYFLGNHLLQIQVFERLRYIKDYQEFHLVIEKKENCENEILSLFTDQDTVYEGVCISNVFVRYGSTKAPLQMVLNAKYITLSEILKKLTVVPVEMKEDRNLQYYAYTRSEKEEENYLVTVADVAYQTIKNRRVVFEIYQKQEEEVVDEMPTEVVGTVEISGQN